MAQNNYLNVYLRCGITDQTFGLLPANYYKKKNITNGAPSVLGHPASERLQGVNNLIIVKGTACENKYFDKI